MFGKREYADINVNLNRAFADRDFLIVKHRGGNGNIIENTIPAFNAARLQGADMFELDVAKSIDDVLYCFHTGMESKNYLQKISIKELTAAEIDELVFYNTSLQPCAYKTERLENVFKTYTHGEIFNLDRAQDHFELVFDLIRKYPYILRQGLVKSAVRDNWMEFLDKSDLKVMFMPIVEKEEEIEKALSYKNINIVGFECIFRNEQSKFWQDEFIEEMHRQGYFLWANPITLCDNDFLTAGYNDDKSVKESFDKGWGKLIDKGYDVFQTDWVDLLSKYRDSRKK